MVIVVALLIGALPAAADDLDAILAAGVIRAGVCLTAEPVGFLDGNLEPRGYDVDVATLLAAALEVRLELVEVTVATRIHDLLDRRIDIIVCNMTATPARAREIDFSFPYLKTGLKLMVPVGSALGSLDDAGEGTRIIVHRGTTGEQLARERVPGAEFIYAETPGDAVLLIRQGAADAYVEDSLVIDTLARQHPDLVAVRPETYTMDGVSFGIRKGNYGFLRWLDVFASTFVSSGRYAEVYGKWWGEPPPEIFPVW
jgi:polar amino acid transport system substrate-binding protein